MDYAILKEYCNKVRTYCDFERIKQLFLHIEEKDVMSSEECILQLSECELLLLRNLAIVVSAVSVEEGAVPIFREKLNTQVLRFSDYRDNFIEKLKEDLTRY